MHSVIYFFIIFSALAVALGLLFVVYDLSREHMTVRLIFVVVVAV